jgi:UDP-N-acetylmuramyl pentapeptide phosphotransferase/UDP-N-acetylglucosamine-1-phosphate transferase
MENNGTEPVEPDREKGKIQSELIGGIIFVSAAVLIFLDPDLKPSPPWAYVIWIAALLCLFSFGIFGITDAILGIRRRKRK